MPRSPSAAHPPRGIPSHGSSAASKDAHIVLVVGVIAVAPLHVLVASLPSLWVGFVVSTEILCAIVLAKKIKSTFVALPTHLRVLTLLWFVSALVISSATFVKGNVLATRVTRTATLSSNPSVYEPITPRLYATRDAEEIYVRFGSLPEPLYVRWVKCGHTSTQDQASTVGGNALYVDQGPGVLWVIGYNFKRGSCVRIWARGARSLSYRPSFSIDAYFDMPLPY